MHVTILEFEKKIILHSHDSVDSLGFCSRSRVVACLLHVVRFCAVTSDTRPEPFYRKMTVLNSSLEYRICSLIRFFVKHFATRSILSILKSRSKERFEAKKPYDFDRNQNRSSLYKKEQPNTTGKKPRKFKLIKFIWLLGQ